MDHNGAIRLQAAEKYALGELSGALREEFEEHFFDCPVCAEDVKAVTVFADNARDVLRRTGKKTEKERVMQPSGWFGWLKPVVAVPAFAVLLLALAYQSFVSVPHWKELATQSTAPRVLPMFSLITANTRGPEASVLHVRQGESLGLYVDIPVDSTNRTYMLRLEDPAGNSTILRFLTYEEAQKTQVVQVNPGKRRGAYQIVVLGMTNADGDPRQASVLATMKFQVELQK